LFTKMGSKKCLQKVNQLLEKYDPGWNQEQSKEVLTYRRHLDSLIAVTHSIGSVFVLDELLNRIVEFARKVTGAERCFLLLEKKKRESLVIKAVAEDLEEDIYDTTAFSYEKSRISLVLVEDVRKGHAARIATPYDKSTVGKELISYDVKQAMCVPLSTHDTKLGVLYLDNRLADGVFGSDELELMKTFAIQAAVAIENTRLIGSLVEQNRFKQELEMGRSVQIGLLPTEVPVVLNLIVAGSSIPAREIGGDYYDFVELKRQYGEIRLGIAVGDVSGKGLASGIYMAMAKTAISTLSLEMLDVKTILSRVNEVLIRHIDEENFMSMVLMEWQPEKRTLYYAGAGHEHILVYRHEQEEVEVIATGGIVLGLMPDIYEIISEGTIELKESDKVVLFSDGVTEAQNIQKEQYSIERLVEAVKHHGHHPCNALLEVLNNEVQEYMGDTEQYDDITIVVLECIED